MTNAGMIVVFASGRACHLAWPLEGGSLVLGRETELVRIVDDRVSRRHAKVSFDGWHWTVEDLGSRNGTVVDGVRIEGRVRLDRAPIVRVGETLLLATNDVYAHDPERVRHGDRPIVGAALARAWARIESAARGGSRGLHVVGESGAGIAAAARHFHDCGASGPFVTLRCRTLGRGAEGVLFGPGGFVHAAAGGTLFLDDIGALAPDAQEKLAGACGAIRLCTSSDRPLEGDPRVVSQLAARVGSAVVTVPALAERKDEIAWHAQHQLAACGPDFRAHVSLIEACMLTKWPGHVRQLRAEIYSAAMEAVNRGSHEVLDTDLVSGRKTSALRAHA